MEGPSCARHMSPGGPGALSTGTQLGAAGRRLSANKGCSERSVDLLRALGPAGNAESSSPVAYLLPRGGTTAGPAPKLSRLWAGGTAPCTPRPVGCLLAPGWPPGFPGLWGEEEKVLTLVTHATVPLPVSAPPSPPAGVPSALESLGILLPEEASGGTGSACKAVPRVRPQAGQSQEGGGPLVLGPDFCPPLPHRQPAGPSGPQSPALNPWGLAVRLS